MRRLHLHLLIAWVGLSTGGCSSQQRTIRIPDSVVPNPKSVKGRSNVIQPYVIKMSDGTRTWQIEIPVSDGGSGFQVVVPLNLAEAAAGAPALPETEADREIRDASKPEPSSNPHSNRGNPSGTKSAEPASETGKSYLATLARVNGLFRKRQYELALIEIVGLEREYPDDARILEMKGTLYWRLRKPKLAKEAWERVLALDPQNTAVAQALENLLE